MEERVVSSATFPSKVLRALSFAQLPSAPVAKTVYESLKSPRDDRTLASRGLDEEKSSAKRFREHLLVARVGSREAAREEVAAGERKERSPREEEGESGRESADELISNPTAVSPYRDLTAASELWEFELGDLSVVEAELV